MSPKLLLVANTDWYLHRFRLSLARDVRQHGWEVVLVSPPGPYVPAIEAAGFRHLPWAVGRRSVNPWREARAVWAFRQILRHEAPNVVHLHTIKPLLYGALAARGLPVAMVGSVTGRGFVFLGQGWQARLLRGGIRPLYRWATRRLQRVIFENRDDMAFFLQAGLVRAEQATLIEGVGVDVELFRPLPEPQGPPTAVLAGRMLWDKGVGVFVAAARLLRQQMPEARLVLVGRPDPGNPASVPEDTLQAWAAEGVVEWWGWQEDIRGVFAAAHVVTLPSLGEGLPTVLLEAAASGRAIVTTDVTGCREVVRHGETGLLVPPNDPQALAQALERLLRDAPLRQRLAAAARRLAESRFSQRQINRQTWALYASLPPAAPPRE